jgi:hypothetical protein
MVAAYAGGLFQLMRIEYIYATHEEKWRELQILVSLGVPCQKVYGPTLHVKCPIDTCRKGGRETTANPVRRYILQIIVNFKRFHRRYILHFQISIKISQLSLAGH